MPVQILTVRLLDADGQVVAARRKPFHVRDDSEDESAVALELWRIAEALEEEASRHHWWWSP